MTTIEQYEQTNPRYVGEARLGKQTVRVGAGRKQSMGRTVAATSEGWVATEILWVETDTERFARLTKRPDAFDRAMEANNKAVDRQRRMA